VTAKRRLFVRHYTNEARWNATKAAELAGYAEPRTEGWRLLRDAEIRTAINTLLEQEAMSAAEVLARLREHAAADLGPFMDANGQVDLEAMKEAGLTHLIREYSFEEVYLGGNLERPPDIVQKRKVKLVSSQGALTLLGKYHKLFQEREEALTPRRVTEILEHFIDIIHAQFGEDQARALALRFEREVVGSMANGHGEPAMDPAASR